MSEQWQHEVTCAKCKARPGERCRTLTTGRVTDTHAVRWEDRAAKAMADQAERRRQMRGQA